MKTLRLAITALLLLGFSPYIQGQITLSSQAEVDAWDQSITVIEDTIIITGSDITNIDALVNVSDIAGLLEIRANRQLTSIDGLGGLKNVTGTINIISNQALTSINGFLGLNDFDGSILIQFNDGLENIDGFRNLIDVSGSITLWNNDGLRNVDGFINLRFLSGSISITNSDLLTNIDALKYLGPYTGSLALTGNDGLKNIDIFSEFIDFPGSLSINGINSSINIDGLSSLTNISGRIALLRIDSLINLDVFSNLTNVSGILSVSNNKNLVELNGLSNIRILDGTISLSANPSLTNIDGLSELRQINGELKIVLNEKLNNINGLVSLDEISGELEIKDNDQLNNLNVIEGFTDIHGTLIIENNDALTSLNELASLNQISGTITIKDNFSLIDVDGFLGLKEIAGTINIIGNPQLKNLNGFSNLTTISGTLSIGSNSGLTNINGLSKLNEISGRLNISSHENLNDLSALSNLQKINGQLSVFSNTGLTHLDGLSEIDSILGSLVISRNNSLQNIDGFSGISTVVKGGKIEINANPSLTNVNGLSGLETMEGNLFIIANESLENIDGLLSLNEVSGTADIRITDNDAITKIDGLANITSIKRRLNLTNNDALENLDGLSNLTEMTSTGVLEILGNISLQNIDGLSNLSKIDGILGGSRLIIQNNDALRNIDALFSINDFKGRITVKDNDLLSGCCSLINLLESTDHTRFDISNNNTNCDSISEILDVCSLVINFNQTRPCEGADNGSINIFASDYDTIPFHYDWSSVDSTLNGSGISYQDIFAVNGLPAGSYNVTITLPNGSREVISDIVLDPITGSIFEITQLTTTNSTNGTASGNLFIKYEGGVGPYSLNWNGPNPGSRTGVTDDFFTIFGLGSGEYTVQIIDANNQSKLVSITLLDETVPIFPCSEPLDIIILNDVSGSVDPVEYKESKEFFVDFLKSANIGLDTDKSQATIIEWSGTNEQEIKVQHTGNISKLESYEDATRAFTGGTSPHPAMEFGAEYIEAVGRSDVEKVFVLSTDGTPSQSLISLADQFKARGYHIVTIAFDAAFSLSTVRSILTQTASIPLLAPGARAYSELSTNLADNIVNLYLCPLNPGNSSSVYFYRDASIEISAVESDCPLTGFATVNFDVAAKRELSVPAGTSVMFYHNDPFLFGATPILEYELPCAIPTGSADSHSVILPINSPTKLYAMLNDDGRQNPPFQYPITELEEIAYTNNVDTVSICVGDSATIQALKYTSTPTPICDSVLIYTIDVCNISSLDARGVEIQDLPPPGAKLVTTAVNLNGCATSNGVNYNIPADCCVSLTLTYASNNIPAGFYQAQSVLLDGPGNQIYIAYDGTLSGAEDIAVGSDTENCPSKVIALAAEVNAEAICEDGFLEYTFTIANETSSTIQGATFVADLPTPMNWIFQPYNKRGLSINAMSLSGTRAEFVIDEILADTIASFSLDAYTGDWVSDGIAFVSGMLVDVIDLNNGGLQDLESESVSTSIYSNENSQSRCDSLLTSVEKVIPKSEIIIYPNPTDGTVEIKNVTTPVSYKLISAAGIEYETGIYEDGALELKHEGVNLLVLYSKNQVEIFKVIKLTN